MRNNNMDALNRAAFDNFDNFEDDFDDSYDDSYDDSSNFEDNYNGQRAPGSQIRRSRPQTGGNIAVPSAEFNVTITNAQAVAVPVELFNFQYSVTKFNNQVSAPGYLPTDAFNVATFVLAGPINTKIAFMGTTLNAAGIHAFNSVGFDASGNLIYYNEVPGLSTTISCQEVPYRALYEYSGRGSFRVTRMRLSSTTAGQLANSFTWQHKSFLGKATTQVMSVQSSKSPDQFQNLLVDLKRPFKIDAEKGLFYTVNANETVTITMSVAEYVRSAI